MKYIFIYFTEFCEMFDGFVLAEGSYKTCEYYRALMYLEQHMAISKKGLTDSKERDLLVVSLIFLIFKLLFQCQFCNNFN